MAPNFRAESLPRCIHSTQKYSSKNTCQLLYSQTSNSGLLFAFIFKHRSGFICYHRNQFKFGCMTLELFKNNLGLILNHCALRMLNTRDATSEKWKMPSAVTPRKTMSIFSLSPLRDTPNRTRRMTEVYCPETSSIFTIFLSHAFAISPKFLAVGLGRSWSWRMSSEPGTAFTSTKNFW